jgi:ribonuclease HI
MMLVMVGNEQGHRSVDLQRLYRELHELRRVGPRDIPIRKASWTPKPADKATADVSHMPADKTLRWSRISEVDKQAIHRPPRRFKRAKRRAFLPASHVASAQDLEERAERDCTAVAQMSIHVRFKYAWQDAHYTDGSAKDDETLGHLVGAAVWRTCDGQHFLIRPNGKGVTNTINRAELSAIYHVLADLASPTEPVLIFTDSQVSIQLINRTLRRPDKETGVHKDLLMRIAELILQRARNGHRVSILKVKAHTGITGNEAADQAAKTAAQHPERATLQTPACHPFAGRWWPVHTPRSDGLRPPTATAQTAQPADVQSRAISNLGKSLKQAAKKSTKLGGSNKNSYYVQATQPLYTDPEGAHPEASNAFWGSNKCTHPAKSLTIKARGGVLYTGARAKMLGLATTDSCPLCGDRDSIGHMLGRCAHHSMQPLYISRHDDAVIKIYKALQKGDDGGFFTIIDAGTMKEVLHTLTADGKRVPDWLLPNTDADTLRRMRPDILRIQGLPAHPTAPEIQEACTYKRHYKIQLIEVGYCSDFNWKKKLEDKKQQHAELINALRAEGWETEEHYIILGSKGTILKDATTAFQKLGLTKTQAVKLMSSLNIHTVNWLATIVRTRRQQEQQRTIHPNRRGIG